MPEIPGYQIIRGHRRSLSIQIDRHGKLVVKAPYLVPTFFVKRFVNEKRGWIDKQLARAKNTPIHKPLRFQQDDEFLYLGEKYPLQIGDFKEISVSNTLHFPKFLQFRIQKELTEWYIRQAKEIITKRVSHNCKILKTNYKSISFSDTISKWGSCSKENHLQFNWRLVMAPMLVIDYVVVHELVHTREKNHGNRFWRIVASYKPAYKQYKKWLRAHSHALHSFFQSLE